MYDPQDNQNTDMNPTPQEPMSYGERMFQRAEDRWNGVKPQTPEQKMMSQFQQAITNAIQQAGMPKQPTEQAANPFMNAPETSGASPSVQAPKPVSTQPAANQNPDATYAAAYPTARRPDGSLYSEPPKANSYSYAQNPLGAASAAGTSPANTAPRPSTTTYGGVQREGNSFSSAPAYSNPLGGSSVTYGAIQPLSDESKSRTDFWKGAPMGMPPQSPAGTPTQSLGSQMSYGAASPIYKQEEKRNVM